MNYSDANDVLEAFAKKSESSVARVRKELETIINYGVSDSNIGMQAHLIKMAKNGTIPTVEEVIIHFSKEIEKQLTEDDTIS